MYGAILGDIIGSPYERDTAYTKDFPLFRKKSHFTDDTVMTIAIADAMMKIKDYIFDYDNSTPRLAMIMQHWGRRYPHAGYGRGFKHWLNSEVPKPYNSNGNGSAMRVSPVGWLYKLGYFDDIECIRKAARLTASVTHNSEEGLKGAESVAAAIYLAGKGKSKAEIKDYIESEFGYDLSRTIEEIRPRYQFEVSCQKSVPESIIAFLESEDFESAVRNAIWLGGDADTQAAIAGSIAEAFYGIPKSLINECRNRLPDEMLEVLDKFYEAIGGPKIVASPKNANSNKYPDIMFIHTSAGGAMGDAGAFDVLSIRGRRGHHGHINFKDLPSPRKRNKNGFTYFYMGCGHDLYVNDKVLDIFCKNHDIDDTKYLEINYFMWKEDAKKSIAEYNSTHDKNQHKKENRIVPKEPILLDLKRDIITKEFFKDMMYFHVALGGPYCEGYMALLNAKGELYTGNFLGMKSDGNVMQVTDNGLLFDVEEALVGPHELPDDEEMSRNGWTYFDLGWYHVLYVNDKVLDSFEKYMKFDDEKGIQEWLEAGMKSLAELE